MVSALASPIFCTSLREWSCTRNVTLNSPPRERSGKALLGKFDIRNKGLTVTKSAENGVSGSVSRRGVLQAAHKWPISSRRSMTAGNVTIEDRRRSQTAATEFPARSEDVV